MTKIKRRYGWKPDKLDDRDKLYVPEYRVVPPSQVDLRAGFSAIYDQGELGSCTANAVAAHLDFNRHKQGEGYIEPSRLFIYYNERKDDGDVSEDAGSSIRESVKAVKKYGAVPEADWPYDISKFTIQPPQLSYTKAHKYSDLTYLRVIQAQTTMQLCLAGGYPFVTGISVYESFESPAVAASGIVPLPGPSEQLLGGHAVVCVGYKLVNGSLHWIMRNSWGAKWGSAGYFYLPWRYLLDPSLSSDMWSLRVVK